MFTLWILLVVLRVVLIAPHAAWSADRAGSGESQAKVCRLAGVPDSPLSRGIHTTLLASFDAKDNNDATYARVHKAEVGLGSEPDVPGKFGSGVAIAGQGGDVRFAGLDNYNPLCGTV